MDGDDVQLLARCVAGDQLACATLVDAHARLVGTVIWRATGEQNVVEDLVQETFLRVFRGLPAFRGQAKLSTWVCTIAHRVAIDHVRRRATAPTISGDVPDAETGQSLIGRLEDRRSTPEEVLEVKQMHGLIREQVAQLPEKYRVPLVYTAIDGLDYGTIAAMLDMPVGTVKTLVFRAKQRIRERIGHVLQRTAGGAS